MKRGLLTPKQAREMLGVSRSTLYRWRKEGLLTVYRLPIKNDPKMAPCRYDPEEIEKLLKSEG